MANLIGKTIKNRYRVVEFLGRGGMAEVYKVEDTQRGVYLAIKVLREDLGEDKVFLRRFQCEAQNLAKLQHPNIVRFYGLEQEGRLAFILMDFIEGTTLRGVIFDANKPLPNQLIIEIFTPVCKALHYAHQTGIVHCDVKTSNIMIDKHGTVYLADFGIARIADAATSTMVGIGTPAYMAPELIRGENPTPQTDIYSLGIVLYEMLTGGERPFTGEHASITGTTAEKVRWEQVRLAPESPRKFNKKISPEMEAVVMRCLQKDPAKRFASSLELLDALHVGKPAPEALRKTKERLIPERREEIVKPRVKAKKKKTFDARWLIGTVGVVAVGLMVFAGIKLAGGGEEPQPAAAEKTAVPQITETSEITTELTPIPTLGIGSTMDSEKDGMTMIYVPAGEFLMGSKEGDADADDDEFPQHTVDLDAYWIDQTEVTNAMFAAFLNEKENQKEGGSNWLDSASKYARISKVNDTWKADIGYGVHPVVEVSWYGADSYCQWAGRRLPTEGEWEKAARGEKGNKYPWGESISCSQANYWGCTEFPSTFPVGYYGNAGASPYGALNMAGNVRELV